MSPFLLPLARIFHRRAVVYSTLRPSAFAGQARGLGPAVWLMALLLGPLAGFAETYYVSSTVGDDANPGTTVQAPWRTLAKVNASRFSPGDVISFRRGESWAGESLQVSSSGTAEAPIVYGAYGGGPKPLIDPGADHPDAGISVLGRSHVRVEDFDLRRGGNGVRCMGNSAHIEMLRIDVADSRGPGIVVRNASHILIDTCRVTRAGNNGILMGGSAEEPKANHCIVQNCVVSDLRSNDGIVIHQDSKGNAAGANFIFRNNLCFNCPEQGFDLTGGTDVLLEDNVTIGNGGGGIVAGHVARRVTVRRHHSEDEPTSGSSALTIKVPFVTVEHSRFIGPKTPRPGRKASLIAIGPGSESQPEDVQLLNNTFVWNSAEPGNFLNLSNLGTAGKATVTIQRLKMHNNIFTSRTAAPVGVIIRQLATPLTTAGFDLDHNLYHNADSAGVQWSVEGQPHDFTAFRREFGKEAHGLESDPGFISVATGDFRLQPGSPAIDAGDGVVAAGATDAFGVSVPQGGAPDLGAHEFTAAPGSLPAPVNLTAPSLARTATTALLLWDRPAGGESIRSYQIFRDGELAGETASLSFTARHLTPGGTHHFTVRSRGAHGATSRHSVPVIVRLPAAGPVLDVRAHGARGDGVTKDTAAIQRAIAECPPGGTVLVPPGVYAVDHLELKGDLTFEVATGATLQFLGRGQGNYPVIAETLPGPDGDVAVKNFSLLTARDARNLRITGGGRINGNGASWWPHRLEGPRPRLFTLIRCADVLVQGLTLEDSPSWNTHVVHADRAVFSGLTFLKVSPDHGTNGDGLNPDSSRDVLIVGCRFGNQDDSIAIKSGSVSADRPNRQRASEDITIRDCVFDGSLAPGANPLGIAIGSENCGGVRRVLVRDCVFRNAASVAYLKTNRDRKGAVIEDIRVENCVFTSTAAFRHARYRAPISIDMMYYDTGDPADAGTPPTPATPLIRDIHFRNIVIDEAVRRPVILVGLPEQPVRNVTFTNVSISGPTGLHGQNLDGITLKDVKIEAQTGPAYVWINARNRTLSNSTPTAP